MTIVCDCVHDFYRGIFLGQTPATCALEYYILNTDRPNFRWCYGQLVEALVSAKHCRGALVYKIVMNVNACIYEESFMSISSALKTDDQSFNDALARGDLFASQCQMFYILSDDPSYSRERYTDYAAAFEQSRIRGCHVYRIELTVKAERFSQITD